jgi:hypothetical protein
MTLNLHPDDLLFFNEVAAAMRRVAARYELPLRTVSAFPMPASGMAGCKGDCATWSGDIRLVMRCTVDGVFCDEPRTPSEVWETAAHELSHLRHPNHGAAFQSFRLELSQALKNQQEDHKEKVLARLVKMQASRDGEAVLGNSEAAEAFAAAINRMLLEHELSPSDIDYARATDKDPVIEIQAKLLTYGIDVKKQRIAWQESLARIVAKAHLCTFLIRRGSNEIFFVGTKSHATVAEYAYGTLVPAAEKMSTKAKYAYGHECFKRDGHWKGVNGFREAWLAAFIDRIGERFEEARRAAVATAPEGSSVALMRLDGALIKARKYTDDKFQGRRGVSALNSMRVNSNLEGGRRGRAAADAMTIGRRGVSGASDRKRIGNGE